MATTRNRRVQVSTVAGTLESPNVPQAPLQQCKNLTPAIAEFLATLLREQTAKLRAPATQESNDDGKKKRNEEIQKLLVEVSHNDSSSYARRLARICELMLGDGSAFNTDGMSSSEIYFKPFVIYCAGNTNRSHDAGKNIPFTSAHYCSGPAVDGMIRCDETMRSNTLEFNRNECRVATAEEVEQFLQGVGFKENAYRLLSLVQHVIPETN